MTDGRTLKKISSVKTVFLHPLYGIIVSIEDFYQARCPSLILAWKVCDRGKAAGEFLSFHA